MDPEVLLTCGIGGTSTTGRLAAAIKGNLAP